MPYIIKHQTLIKRNHSKTKQNRIICQIEFEVLWNYLVEKTIKMAHKSCIPNL